MPKSNIVFFCKECGFESAKWMGQCPGCHAWNTFLEEPAVKIKTSKKSSVSDHRSIKATPLSQVSMEDQDRVNSGMKEFDRVLGGGIVKGSVILVGGDPGIGKSTILLQMCKNLAEAGKNVLYISGEESLKQIKMRALRIGEFKGDIQMASETSLTDIENLIERSKPEFVIIDSIQTMFREDLSSAPGSVSQIRESTGTLVQIGKQSGISMFIVGHVTKEGTVAGPRVLEHMVDTVLYFEGDRSQSYRILRAVKNRFGATNEIGIFEMMGQGLVEVENPSDYMLNGRLEEAAGSLVSCVMEGTRPMLLEIQALVCKTNFGLPRRTAVGVDYNRVNLLLAVMEKKAGIHLSEADVYVNITGGMRVNDPALDLAVVLAVYSAIADIPLGNKDLVFGEVGLTGEIRGVAHFEERIREAVKLGYERIIVPKISMQKLSEAYKKYCIPVASVKEAVGLLKGHR